MPNPFRYFSRIIQNAPLTPELFSQGSTVSQNIDRKPRGKSSSHLAKHLEFQTTLRASSSLKRQERNAKTSAVGSSGASDQTLDPTVAGRKKQAETGRKGEAQSVPRRRGRGLPRLGWVPEAQTCTARHGDGVSAGERTNRRPPQHGPPRQSRAKCGE